MYSNKEYDDKGFKIFRSHIKPGKYFNKISGNWVSGYSEKINKAREDGSMQAPVQKILGR